MDRPKWSGVNPQGRGIGIELWELKAERDKPRTSNGNRALVLSGRDGSRANTGDRASRVTDT